MQILKQVNKLIKLDWSAYKYVTVKILTYWSLTLKKSYLHQCSISHSQDNAKECF